MGDERHELRHDGRELVVRTRVGDKGHNHAELLVDDVVVAEGGTEEIGSVRLEGEGVVVRVSWWWTGRPWRVALVVPHGGAKDELVAFAPPAGTRRARLHQWTTRHPGLWAARHVLVAAGQVLFGLLGVLAVGLVLNLALPRVPWPGLDIPRPDWDIPWPDLPDFTIPGWAKLIGPLLIATAVAGRELDRRRKRQRPPEENPPTAGPKR